MNLQKIKTQVVAEDWQDAIRKAGALLVAAGSCEQAYVEAMVQSVKELGPYIVLTPHVALAHARPSAAVKENDISLVVLKNPINFNHEANDPVNLVFAFCAKSNEGHMEQLGKLSNYLSDQKIIEQVANAKTAETVLTIFEQAN